MAERYQRFGRTCCLHLRGKAHDSSLFYEPALCLQGTRITTAAGCFTLLPCKGRQHVRLKCVFLSTKQHGVTSQNSAPCKPQISYQRALDILSELPVIRSVFSPCQQHVAMCPKTFHLLYNISGETLGSSTAMSFMEFSLIPAVEWSLT